MTNAGYKIVHCNSCFRKTRHNIIAVCTTIQDEIVWDDEPPLEFYYSYKMLQCRGCESVVLEREISGELLDEPQLDYFPPAVARQLPGWLKELPDDVQAKDIRELFTEIYHALNSNGTRLAMMGARALVDIFMNRTIGDVGGFREKLNELERQKYINGKNKEYLEAALEIGHATIHREFNPSLKNVNHVMNIIENLIETIVLEKQAKELKAETPKRERNR
jgi:hypothetical protein